MSINKQLYFGIFGICALFGGLCLFLILLASTKLFFSYNLKVKAIFNEIDTNVVSLNGENADLFGQLLFNQGKFETYLIRKYYNILNEEFGIDLINIINIGTFEMDKHFIYSNDNLESECDKCFFVFTQQNINIINDLTKKLLYILKPIIEISLETHAYCKEKFFIFNKFYFYEKENDAFISYKFDKEDIKKNFDSSKTPKDIMNNIIISFLSTIKIIENLNQLNVEEISNYQIFEENTYTIFPSLSQGIIIDPFYKNLTRTFHFSSFQFNKNEFIGNDKINIEKIKLSNLENYLSFDIKIDYLSTLSLDFMERNGMVLIFIITSNFQYTASKSACRLVQFTNITYSDESIHNNLNFSVKLLGIEEFQYYEIENCFENKKFLQVLPADYNYNFSLKILSNLYKYSYDKDINNNIIVKIVRSFSPNKYIKALTKLRFYSSFSVYFLVAKIYNNILVINLLIDRITYRSIAYISLFTFFLWVAIFIFILIKLYLVADRISSPIRKLIKNISLSQGNFDENGANLEKIYYREDKDINDLFQLCQRLIIGGFKKKNNIKKQNKLNVYNNISRVKTNNMIINENDIIMQRNQKYNEIFEKGNELEYKEEGTFKEEFYHHFKNEDLNTRIQNYEYVKIKKIPPEKKDELENLKIKDSEYKMFYFINKEIEGFLPYNILYKCYYDEFSKKGNKKKKK